MKLSETLVRDTAGKKKRFAVLIDPDKASRASLKKLALLAGKAGVDYFFFGGSLLMRNDGDRQIRLLKENCSIPVILFPGNTMQVYPRADAILLLSLISGRNPEMLIGRHVESAALLSSSKLEIIPTGYMLIDSGRQTSVSYISNTQPIPSDKPDIAVCTALAGEMLGLRIIYLDAGSGAVQPVPSGIISGVKKAVKCPLIVGGGISDVSRAKNALAAGADIIVIGNAIEKNPALIEEVAGIIK